MFHIRDEGQQLHNGFNFYSLSNKGQAGFVFKLGMWIFRFRYSKIANKWFIG